MISSNKLLKVLLFLAVASVATAQETEYQFDGHVKTRLLGDWYPKDSFFYQLAGDNALDLDNDLRLNFNASNGSWEFDAAWQLFAGYGDRKEFTGLLPSDNGIFRGALPDDDRRLFNLTSVIEDEGKFAALHRLDRVWVGYTGDKAVLRFGRQAISWGNGLIFSPLDIVNPFDPTTVDTEYKAGDDMLYGQYLSDNGNDIQAAYVFRRDLVSGDPDSKESTAAVKYHGILGESEYDFLLAQHYNDSTFGIGGNRSLGGAVLRGDLIITDATSGTKTQAVVNLSYSWIWSGKNVSGVVEYYFNEFGQEKDRYDLASIANNTDLAKRLARGDAFTIGRHYLAGGITVELTPLWTLTPNVFANLEDGSALVQVVSNHNLSQNAEFRAALNVPLGPSGSEFGGIGTAMPGVYLSTDLALFAQFAYYF